MSSHYMMYRTILGITPFLWVSAVQVCKIPNDVNWPIEIHTDSSSSVSLVPDKLILWPSCPGKMSGRLWLFSAKTLAGQDGKLKNIVIYIYIYKCMYMYMDTYMYTYVYIYIHTDKGRLWVLPSVFNVCKIRNFDLPTWDAVPSWL